MGDKNKEVVIKTYVNEMITMLATKKESDNLNSNKIFNIEIYNTINNGFHNILKTHLKEKGRIKRKIKNQKLKSERINGYKFLLINNLDSQLILENTNKEEQNRDDFMYMINDFANNIIQNRNYVEDENEELNNSNEYATTQINTQLRNNDNINNNINHNDDINHNNIINANDNIISLEINQDAASLFEGILKIREEEMENGSLFKAIYN